MSSAACVFCRIASHDLNAPVVWEDGDTIVFLDHSPLFPGHCLVCPKKHAATLPDLPAAQLAPLFSVAQQTARAVEAALGAEGSFVAINNKVSQTVPHLHIHVIPRRRGDGLKGFFWPRHPYRDENHMTETQEALRKAMAEMSQASAKSGDLTLEP